MNNAPHQAETFKMQTAVDGFNPRHPRYKACCCHSKTYTIVAGCIEIISIFFLIIAIIPALNVKACLIEEQWNNDIYELSNYTTSYNQNNSLYANGSLIEDLVEMENNMPKLVTFVVNFACHGNYYILAYALVQFVIVNLMLCGVKTGRHYLFVIHLLFRIVVIGVLIFLIVFSINLMIAVQNADAILVILVICFVIYLLFIVYATYVEIQYWHYIKRTRETGFSISIAQPLGSISLSLNDREYQPPRVLPPLRHTYGNRETAQKYSREENST